MRDGAFENLIERLLAGRSRRAALAAAGLPESSLKNMRDRPTMPSAAQIAEMARALNCPASTLTIALLQDRGYDLGGDANLSALAATASAMTAAERHALEQVAGVIVDLRSGEKLKHL